MRVEKVLVRDLKAGDMLLFATADTPDEVERIERVDSLGNGRYRVHLADEGGVITMGGGWPAEVRR